MPQDLEVDLTTVEGGSSTKAIIEGRTSVPFKTFVSLILQRKVQTVFKHAQEEPVIVSSELLTRLASAPDDRPEDRTKLVIVTLGVGVIVGVFLSAVILLALSLLDVRPGNTELLVIIGVIGGVALLVSILLRMQGGKSSRQKLYEKMERMTDFLMK